MDTKRAGPGTGGRWRGLAVLMVTTGLMLGLVELGLGWMPARTYDGGRLEPGLLGYDARLGWRLMPGVSVSHLHPQFDVRYTIGPEGWRVASTGEQVGAGADSTVLVLGDSFTFGIGVQGDETFAARLAEFRPRERVINAGVIGYATDQTVLWAEELTARLKVDRIVLVVYLGNDLIDNMHPVSIQAPRAKPHFVPAGGVLELRNVPVPRLRQEPRPETTFADAVLGPDHRPSLAERVLRRTRLGGLALDAYRAKVGSPVVEFGSRLDAQIELLGLLVERLSVGGVPVVLGLLGGQSLIEEPGSYSAQYQDYVAGRLLARPWPTNVTPVDLSAALAEARRASPNGIFIPDEGHLTVHGHAVVAQALRSALDRP